MKMKMLASAVFLAVLSMFTARAAEDIKVEAQQAMADFKKADSTLQAQLDTAAGWAIFPNVGKGGLIIGAAHGDGLVYAKGGRLIGQATMTQASIGAQAGGQSFAELILFENEAALNDFKSGKFEMSAEVSAIAAAEGASKAAQYKHGVAVFTLSRKGLMVSATVGGQKFKFEPLLTP